jgi:DNA-binding CsgD family transcriptional regulator
LSATEATQPAGPSLDALVENVPGNVYRRIRRPDGTYRFAYLSSGLFRHFGIDNERLLAEPALRFDWIHPEDRQRFVADLEFSAATLGMLDHRIRIIGHDGRIHWARGIARPNRQADGSVVWDGIVIDVTREVEAEGALRIAKDDAESAQRRTKDIVQAVAEGLRQPIGELSALLATLGADGRLAPAIASSLEGCIAALERATRGQAADPQAAARAQPSSGISALTPRQRDVLTLLSTGQTNKEIAKRLNITPGTAKLHVAAILKATGAANRRQLSAA